MLHKKTCLAAVAAALFPSAAALAQASAAPPRPDPADARAATAPLLHRSAFASYRRLTETPPIAWREANDAVERIGGWRAYAREAQAPAAPAAPASVPAARPR